MCNIDFYRGQYYIWKVQIHSILKQTYDAIQEITEQIILESYWSLEKIQCM